MDSTHAFAGDTKAKSAHDAPSAAIPRVAPSTPTLSVPQSAGATPSASLLASPVEPISAGRIAPTNRNVDDFTSDEDDAQSVIEEAMQEEHQNAQQERVATRAQLDQTESGLMGSRGAFVRVWVWRVIKMLLLVGLLLVPTVVCEVYHTNDCRIQGSTPVWPITTMFAIVIFARFLASFVVMVLMLVVRETPVLGTQFLYYVAGLNRPLRWTVVALIVQVAWLNIFNVLDSASNANGPIINQVGSAVGCLTITAIALLIKSILVRFLAIGYHRGAYYGRIKSGLFAEFVLHSLLLGNKPKADGASRFINSPLSTLQSYVGLVRGNAPEVVEQAPGGNMSGHVAETVPAGASDHRNAVENDATGNTHVTKRNWWTFSRFRWGGNDRAGDRHNSSNSFTFDYIPMNEDEVTDKPISSHKLAVLVEIIKRNHIEFNRGGYRDIIIENMHLLGDRSGTLRFGTKTGIHSTVSSGHRVAQENAFNFTHAQGARSLAAILFERTKRADQEGVYREDFQRQLSAKIASNAFALFDGNWDGSLSEKEFYTTLLSISRERKALRTALNDAETAIDKLDSAISGVLYLILPVAYLTIFGVDPSKIIVTLSSFLLATAFAIGNTAKTLLESVIFIYVSHPFDIGDRIVLDGTFYTISQMNLLTTRLKRFDNSLFYSRAVRVGVVGMTRVNFASTLARASAMISLQCGAIGETSAQHASKPRSIRFNHTPASISHADTCFETTGRAHRIVLRIWVQHRSNFQNMRRYRERRTRVLLFLKRVCEELCITYEFPPQHVFGTTPTAPGALPVDFYQTPAPMMASN